MSTYKIVNGANGKFHITRGPREDFELFCGYDFMGSVDWSKNWKDAEAFDSAEEAKQIVHDLESADCEIKPPADRKYLFKGWIDDEWFFSIETGKRIAEIYEEDQICGIYGDMEVWDVTGDPKKINILDLVCPILAQMHWMQREYEDYCKTERYGNC